MSEKPLGADAAAVGSDTTGASDQRPHVAPIPAERFIELIESECGRGGCVRERGHTGDCMEAPNPPAAPKHTPGPWRVVHGYREGCIHVVSADKAFETGCISFSGNGLANAHLIAAAPELHEALKRAREALKANEEITGTWHLYQHSPEMKAINAALAKAEGR